MWKLKTENWMTNVMEKLSDASKVHRIQLSEQTLWLDEQEQYMQMVMHGGL